MSLRLIDGDYKLIKSVGEYIDFDLSKDEILNEKLKYIKDNFEKEKLNMENLKDSIVSSIISTGENISKEVITFQNKNYNEIDRKIDSILTSKTFGMPIMIALLGLVFLDYY